MHLAATLKRLITILLLFALAGQTFSYFHTSDCEVSYLQEADDKGKKGGEEKKAKECILNPSDNGAELSQPATIDSYSCIARISPVLDLLKPPPDVKY